MGNVLNKGPTTSGGRFSRLDDFDSSYKSNRSRSLATQLKRFETRASSVSDLSIHKQKAMQASHNTDHSVALTKPSIYRDDSIKSRSAAERLKKRGERVEAREIESALIFSRHVIESFFQNSFSPSLDYSAMFPPNLSVKMNDENFSEIPERFKNVRIGSSSKKPAQLYQFEPEKDEFKLLTELFLKKPWTSQEKMAIAKTKDFSNPKHQARIPSKTPTVESSASLNRRNGNDASKISSNAKQTNSRISSSYLIEDGPIIDAPSNQEVTFKKAMTKGSNQFQFSSPRSSLHSSNKKNTEDSIKSNQLSNEKQGKPQFNVKSSSAFKIHEGHVFSFQKELNLLSKLSSQRGTKDKEVIVEDLNDEREESSAYINDYSSLKNSNRKKILNKKEVFGSEEPFNAYTGKKLSSADMKNNKELYANEEHEETIDKIANSKKKLSDFKIGTETHVSGLKGVPRRQSQSIFSDHVNSRPNTSIEECPKQVVLDLQLLTTNPHKANALMNSNNENTMASRQPPAPHVDVDSLQGNIRVNNRYKFPSASNFTFHNFTENKFNPNGNTKSSKGEQKPVVSSLKSLLNKKEGSHLIENFSKDAKGLSQKASPGLNNSTAQPKPLGKVVGASIQTTDNAKTYSGLFLSKKSETSNHMSAKDGSPTESNVRSNKDKILENSSKVIRQIREDNGHRRDFSGFSQVKTSEHMQEFESESVEYKIYENILGDLQRSEKELDRFGSVSKVNRVSHSSKESSKHNIQVDIGNLSRKVQFNLDNCFKKN